MYPGPAKKRPPAPNPINLLKFVAVSGYHVGPTRVSFGFVGLLGFPFSDEEIHWEIFFIASSFVSFSPFPSSSLVDSVLSDCTAGSQLAMNFSNRFPSFEIVCLLL